MGIEPRETPPSLTSAWAPHGVGPFERYLEELQTYLRGDSVEFHDSDVDALGLADTPAGQQHPLT